jgi:hypothetical protein
MEHWRWEMGEVADNLHPKNFKHNKNESQNLTLFSANCKKEKADFSYSYSLSIGLPNICVVLFDWVEQMHIKWNADLSLMPQVVRNGSYARSIFWKCSFSWTWSASRYTQKKWTHFATKSIEIIISSRRAGSRL